jgi:hypothetical protein
MDPSVGEEDDVKEDDDDDDYRRAFARESGVVLLVGHSVGATMGLIMMMMGEEMKMVTARRRIQAMVSVAGIADFTVLRHMHLEHRAAYDDFCTGAFGPEESGGWELGNVFTATPLLPPQWGHAGEEEERGVTEVEDQVIVLGQGRADELVEWGQVEILKEGLRSRGWEVEEAREEDHTDQCASRRMTVVELEGGHDDVWRLGTGIAKCVAVAITMLAGGKKRAIRPRDSSYQLIAMDDISTNTFSEEEESANYLS